MDVLEALKTRRTIHSFENKPVDKSKIESVLEAAVFAPNHKLTEPWHFYILMGEKKLTLAERRGQVRRSIFKDPASEKAIKSGEKAYGEMAEVPIVTVVTSKKDIDKPVREKEDYAAAACAIQNMMLAAWSYGIGCYWGTGPLSRDEEARQIIEIPEDEYIVAIIFMGYPALVPEVQDRSFIKKSTWFWEEQEVKPASK
jgi:nitroreductase